MCALFKRKAEVEPIEFHRLVGEQSLPLSPAAPRRGAVSVTLAPMRSLSLSSFSFPFSNITKVREALRLQVMPYAAAGEMELFPVVMGRTGRGVDGVVCFLSPSELPSLEGGVRTLVWPAPLPLVSRVHGTGVTVWMDGENLCSLLWQEGRPVLSRWRPRAQSTPEAELAWFDRCCAGQDTASGVGQSAEKKPERGESFVFDAEGADAARELEVIARESLELCPWLRTVNLSRTALEGAMGLERSVRLMTKAACWLLLMGAFVLAGWLMRWNQVQGRADEVRARSENLYREVFDPSHTARISNPVSLARDRIALLQGGGSEQRELGRVLSDLGAVFSENPSLDVTINVLRYNAEGLDCTGSAPDMSTVLDFRKAWEGRAALSQLDNTQSVSGAGYRFDLRVRW